KIKLARLSGENFSARIFKEQAVCRLRISNPIVVQDFVVDLGIALRLLGAGCLNLPGLSLCFVVDNRHVFSVFKISVIKSSAAWSLGNGTGCGTSGLGVVTLGLTNDCGSCFFWASSSAKRRFEISGPDKKCARPFPSMTSLSLTMRRVSSFARS